MSSEAQSEREATLRCGRDYPGTVSIMAVGSPGRFGGIFGHGPSRRVWSVSAFRRTMWMDWVVS
jgi:hypothetical protein